MLSEQQFVTTPLRIRKPTKADICDHKNAFEDTSNQTDSWYH